ncbi:MAG TPA: L-glutamate gamma-semialdehyde dehydrogenase [Terriglobales bacterium]|nr:L-glutamate gamma-semialdehyde dehydrogenase [Terriglobales bacterium]
MATVEQPRVSATNANPASAPSKAAQQLTKASSSPFKNEPSVDFSKPENQRGMREALARVKSELGREYPLVIAGQEHRTAKKITSTNPARPKEVVGVHQKAGPEHVQPAMDAALRAFETWKFVQPEQRALLLQKTAAIIRERKFEFGAWMVYEVGKNWAEADADVAETIDFLELYSREMLRLAQAEPPVQLPGERDRLWYIPLGVGAVIPPWNFPCAIMAGMTGAAIVAGNTVILKPSSESPTIAAKFFEALVEAGMPAGVVNFCPGGGGDFGQAIVEHPKTRFIAFTGSREVGLGINEAAAKHRQGQIWIKRTILEMGGKDAIIVDSEADLDSALEGVLASAYGFQGQKCSACSRLILDEKVYDAFLERLAPRVRQIKPGDPVENAYMGPVVSKSAYEGILKYIDVARKEGRVLAGGNAIKHDDGGYYIEPTLVADLDRNSRIAQEEIFGPVLGVIKARNFDDALAIANGTEFGLTGAIYTNNKEKLERARREFHVGNLYLNRKCTGAIVGAHPFGGFNMSGTDSKAGGPDYLYLFTQAKSIGEKLS